MTRRRIKYVNRLGRNLADLVGLVAQFEQRKINFESLTEKIETISPAGRLVFHVFAALAEFERNLICERTPSEPIKDTEDASGMVRGIALGAQDSKMEILVYNKPQKVMMKPGGGVIAISMDQETPPIPKPKGTR